MGRNRHSHRDDMRSILFLLISLFSFSVAATPVGWSTNYIESLAAAQTNGRPVLLYFTASWCGPCKLMARSTLVDSNVLRSLAAYEKAAIDIDESAKITADHKVQAVPTFLILAGSSIEVERTTGFVGPEEFGAWLKEGIVRTVEKLAERKIVTAKLAEIVTLLESGESEKQLRGVEMISELSSDGLQELNLPRLFRELAKQNPRPVLHALEGSKLAVRIDAANALREVLGNDFDIDPWASKALRSETVALWRERVENPSRNSSALP